ncbi:hypothetical protein TGVAND_357670 [Toxoplasma gondii VAND]|uniref:Uncharacterized protein n=1 Tax=Toxoplasma gondii VAND TaxID=933077 RepID=A0A086Q295_TOXGO|nr:hypothetical protein TGVAND_357670 [Toxoplasma gondii VAND]
MAAAACRRLRVVSLRFLLSVSSLGQEATETVRLLELRLQRREGSLQICGVADARCVDEVVDHLLDLCASRRAKSRGGRHERERQEREEEGEEEDEEYEEDEEERQKRR